jgi:membrane associated rhomboid family serine protease
MLDKERNIQLALPSPKKLFTPAVTAILVLMIVGYALSSYAEDFALRHLVLRGTDVIHGKVWQLLTYPFIAVGGQGLVFNGLLFLLIGSSVERQWRTRPFVVFLLVVSVTCAVVWVVVSLVLRRNYIGFGMSACGYGLIAAFGMLFYRRLVLAILWTVEAQHLSWFLIGVGIVLGIPQPITWIWVSGAAVAYAYIKLRQGQSFGRAKPRRRSGRPREGDFVDID